MPTTCFVSYEVHPTTMGGCGVLIHHAADLLLKQGHRVVLLLDVPPDSFELFRTRDHATFSHPDRLAAYRVDDLADDFPFSPAQVPCVFQSKSLRFAHALRRLQTREAIDFVEYFEYCGAGYYAFVERLFAEGAGGPVLGARVHGSIEVLDRHGDGLVHTRDHFLLHSFERAALRLAESVLVPSRAYVDAYYTPLYGLPAAQTIVSSPPKQPLAPVSRRPDPSSPFSIIFIGRMFHLKGVDQLVHAAVMLFKRRPDLAARVVLVGYDAPEGPLGSYTQYLRTLIPARFRDRFEFTGQLPHAQLSQRLDDALFAVFPNRVESFCYALHEVYDAGVPVIANALPAFADFFQHESNALLYAGDTAGLLGAMERLIDDHALRRRLERPFPVGEDALGTFYDQPHAALPLAPAQPGPTPSPLVIVLGDSSTPGPVGGWPAVASLRAQDLPGFDPSRQVVALLPSPPDGEETLWWLARPWHARTVDASPREPSDILTTDSILVVRAGDTLDPAWLRRAVAALARRPALAFAGTWITSPGPQGQPITEPGLLDVAPELFPTEQGDRLPRVLVRTLPGVPLCDLLDPSLGALGLIGLVWGAIAKHGLGVLLPQALLHASDSPKAPGASLARERQALLLRHARHFGDRLALLSGLATDPAPPPPPPAPGPAEPPHATVEAKIRIADELGGKTLAKLALRKLSKRVRKSAD